MLATTEDRCIVIQIGNSDDKLTQKEWSEFVNKVGDLVDSCCHTTHFFGGSSNWKQWQNACWVAVLKNSSYTCLTDEQYTNFLVDLAEIGGAYKQDSIAVIEGNTQLLKTQLIGVSDVTV